MQKSGFVRVRVSIFGVRSGPGLHQTRGFAKPVGKRVEGEMRWDGIKQMQTCKLEEIKQIILLLLFFGLIFSNISYMGLLNNLCTLLHLFSFVFIFQL